MVNAFYFIFILQSTINNYQSSTILSTFRTSLANFTSLPIFPNLQSSKSTINNQQSTINNLSQSFQSSPIYKIILHPYFSALQIYVHHKNFHSLSLIFLQFLLSENHFSPILASSQYYTHIRLHISSSGPMSRIHIW